MVLPALSQHLSRVGHHHGRVPQSAVQLFSLQNWRHDYHVVFFGQLMTRVAVLAKRMVALRQTSVDSPLGRSAWCFLLQQILQTPSTAPSRGCRSRRAWLRTAKHRLVYLSGTYALLWVRLAEALTPGLLKADDVHAAHGCNLDYLTDTAVHGIDLWRIYTGAFLSEQITASNLSEQARLHVLPGASVHTWSRTEASVGRTMRC